MKRSRHYRQGIREIRDRLVDTTHFLHAASDALEVDSPERAWEFLDHARQRIEGAMTIAAWAARLPQIEDKTDA